MSPLQFRLAWITVLLLVTVLQAWLSVKNNQTNGQYFWWLFLSGQLPIWAYVSSRTKSLVFDGMLYDTLVVLTFVGVMAALTAKALTATNWAGVFLAGVGLILLKL